MNPKKQNPVKLQSLDEVLTALSNGEGTIYAQIMQSIKLPKGVLEDYCSWSDESYTRNCIEENEKFQLILLCWNAGQITPIHDHGGEECWVKIIEGELKETIYTKDEKGQINIVKSNICKTDDISYMKDFMGYHNLENHSDNRSMSLHLYANPIHSCKVLDEKSSEFVNKDLAYDTASPLQKN